MHNRSYGTPGISTILAPALNTCLFHISFTGKETGTG
ncbi:Uncharacterised protein [Klebsiella pneumoniae]|nr:hypothetical protein HMPREF1308_04984 [Klebsiella pneumoniae subsp. pneumoniae WGLW5]SWC83211.1 Uncharacterised protein [Klebsiella pneumoniae]